MIGPGDQRARPLKIGFKWLCSGRTLYDIRGKGEIADAQCFNLAISQQCALAKRRSECAAKAVAAGMAENDEDVHEATPVTAAAGVIAALAQAQDVGDQRVALLGAEREVGH